MPANIRSVLCFAAVACLVGPFLPATAAAQSPPRIDLELVTDPGFPVDGQQRWASFMTRVNVTSTRIRSRRNGDAPEIQKRGSDKVTVYHVIGELVDRNRLLLPGGTFKYGDVKGLNAWAERLRDGGEEGVTARRVAFGLTPTELVRVNDALSKKVGFKTLGMDVRDAVGKIVAPLSITVIADPAAANAVRGEKVRDELMGLSAGTALAAAVRPSGLVLVPQKPPGKPVQVTIVSVRQVQRSWPVGWPPKESPGRTLPDYFKRLKVEIADIPLSQALEAVQGRLNVPFLLDHNSLARRQIDPTQINVSLPPERTYYKDIIGQLLRQAELKDEVRVDEAGQPFLWITTRR